MASANEPFHWTGILAMDLSGKAWPDLADNKFNLAPLILVAQGLKSQLDPYLQSEHPGITKHDAFQKLSKAVDKVAAFGKHPEFILERWNGGAGDIDVFHSGITGGWPVPEGERIAKQREYRTLLYKHALECVGSIKEMENALSESWLTAGTTHNLNGPIEMTSHSLAALRPTLDKVVDGINKKIFAGAVDGRTLDQAMEIANGKAARAAARR